MEIQMEENRAVVYGSEGEVLAECTFLKEGNDITIDKTFVSEALRGQKMAGRLVERVYQYAKDNHLNIKATCSYAASWLEKNA